MSHRVPNVVPAVALALALLVFGAVKDAWGRDADSPAPESAATASPGAVDDLEEKRAALRAEIEDADRRVQAASGAERDDAKKELAQLRKLDLLLGQQSAARAQIDELADRRSAAQAELAALMRSGLTQKPPYPFLLLDGLRTEREIADARGAGVDVAVRGAEESLDLARQQFEKRERSRREAREAVDTSSDPAQAASLARALRRRELDSRVAAESVALREDELEAERIRRDLQRAEVEMLDARINLVARKTAFDKKELESQIEAIARESDELERSLSEARTRLSAAERAWFKSRQRVERASAPSAVLAEEVEARRLQREAAQRRVTAVARRIDRLNEARQAWNRRYAVAAGTSKRRDLPAWEREVRQVVEQLDRDDHQQAARLAELRIQALNQSQRILTSTGATAEVTNWIQEQQRALQDQLRTEEADLASVQALRRLEGRLLEELSAQSASVPIGRRLAQLWHLRGAIWRYELFAIDDRPITLGKILTGLVLLTIGLLSSGFLSQKLGRRLLPRLGMTTGAAAAFESLSFYLFVALFTLGALRIINIPLTIFTLAGGAIAIGVGFGSQNILNNFISGLILLAEQPIRVGDMVELDGTLGQVEHIGARSTRVRSNLNTHIVVPNSQFLERTVVNWTLSDDDIRTSVDVGVAYGSPTRDVARLLRQAVEEHERVLAKPEPVVLFAGFGDSALLFEVRFCIRVRSLADPRVVESDIRYRIDSLFRAAGIAMAFPQRDVHIGAAGPLSVRLVADADAAPTVGGEPPRPGRA